MSILITSFINSKMGETEFVIVITSYNNEKYYFNNLESVINQKSRLPYQIIYINDCSTDNTGKLVEEYIKRNRLENLITLVNNETRVGNLANIINAVYSCHDNKVIVIVDGDDFLAHEHVLTRLEQEYNTGNTWITFGNFLFYPQGNISHGRPLLKSTIDKNSFREEGWPVVHLRTFKAGLFKKIRIQDLMYNGSFEKMNLAPDVAYSYPMLEMASKGHISYIPDILYIYRYNNPLSEFRQKAREVKEMDDYIRLQKEKYQPLDYL